MHRIHVRAAFAALALVSGVLIAPATAGAQGAPMFTMFGTHGTNSDLVVQPLGAGDCSTAIPFTFSPVPASSTTRYIDVWSASSSGAACQMMANRSSSTQVGCTYIQQFPYTPTNMSAMPTGMTPNVLFGGCSTSTTRTFYFFDTLSPHDVSTSFTTYWVLTAQLNVSPPTAPIIDGAPAGDAQLQLAWNASSFTGLGTMGQVYVYAAAGCSGATSDANGVDGGTTTSTLVAGQPPGSATKILMSSATSPIIIDTSLLGWTAGHYGEMNSIAISTVDSATNISNLSNVVCVQHVQVTGFWKQYCAEHGMPDIAQCTANYHGCSVGAPGPRTDFTAVAFGLGILGVLGARRRRRSR